MKLSRGLLALQNTRTRDEEAESKANIYGKSCKLEEVNLTATSKNTRTENGTTYHRGGAAAFLKSAPKPATR